MSTFHFGMQEYHNCMKSGRWEKAGLFAQRMAEMKIDGVDIDQTATAH